MRLFRMPIRQPDGTTKPSASWYIEWSDHNNRVHRWAAFPNRSESQRFGLQLVALVAARQRGDDLTEQLRTWLEGLSPNRRRLLERYGLFGTGPRSAAPLRRQLDDYRQSLIANECHPQHVRDTYDRAARLIDSVGAVYLADLDPTRVETALKTLRDAGMGTATSNHYLKSIKGLCNWMVRVGRADRNPLTHLRKLNEAFDRRHDRRALTDEELEQLLTFVYSAPDLDGMSGVQRYWSYRLAGELGLLPGELRQLGPDNFDLAGKEPILTVPAAYARKRRQTHHLPLRSDTARGLSAFFQDADSKGSPPFPLPHRTAAMLGADLAAAREEWIAGASRGAARKRREAGDFLCYVDKAGLYADFYSLRHTAITNLGYTARSFADLQALARHRTPAMTARYAHHRLVSMRSAVEGLPSRPPPKAPKRPKARPKRRRAQ